MTTADVQNVDLDSVDLADPAVWDDGVPYELFKRMQREVPVHFSPQNNVPGEGGFWSITRFDDVRAISRDHRTFSSERRGIFHLDDIGVSLDLQRLQLISMDPPRHDRLKALVIKEFTPEKIAEHDEEVRQIISNVLDSVADKERIDLVADVARPIPARVIGSLLGTPPEDDEKLVHWTNVFTAFEDPIIRAQWSDPMAIVAEITEYVNHQLANRTETAGGSLVNTMLTSEVEGEKLTELEIATFFVLLMSAGNDSTRATYSATMQEILRDPELRKQLSENPDLIDVAVEEGLRCYPAFAFMARAATKDTELHGKTITENDRLLLWYIASNRDESVFENPDKFDITREGLADKHQAFGGRGKHFCLGANLARLEEGRDYELLRIQGFTPESPGVTHVFLRMVRNYAIDDGKVGEFLKTMFHEWALRDAGVLETIQRRLDEDIYPRRDINVKADRAAVRARRIAMEMVDEESGRFTLHRILAALAKEL